MFAVIRTGGKQYKVAKDDVISVEKLPAEPGAVVELTEVLMIGEGAEVATGTPLLGGASVSATVVEQTRAPKIIVFNSSTQAIEAAPAPFTTILMFLSSRPVRCTALINPAAAMIAVPC